MEVTGFNPDGLFGPKAGDPTCSWAKSISLPVSVMVLIKSLHEKTKEQEAENNRLRAELDGEQENL